MRILALVCMAIGLVAGAVNGADEAFPYIVHVASDQAAIRSGPGEDYYETSMVPRGTPVEVWREAPGGWLGIRPPKGSFSLVSAAAVRLAPNRLAEAVEQDTPSRVGSELTTDRDVVQVLLEQRETVRVLETIMLDGQFWHRVAPPSGEFRWIHVSVVSGGANSARDEVPETFVPQQNAPAPYRIARHSTAAQEEAGATRVDAPGGGGPKTLADVIQGGADQGAPTIADFEVELATIVAEDSRLWQFDHLRRRCEVEISSADAARQEVLKALLEKIGRFEQIRDKKRAIPYSEPADAVARLDTSSANSESVAHPSQRTDHEPVAPAAELAGSVAWRAARETTGRRNDASGGEGNEAVRIPEGSPSAAEDTGRYDGVGTLRPVVSRRREAPRYALVDSEGDVVTFITPNTGVNLQPYVGQRIGVVGTRGYMPEFKRAHVTAARVTPLR